MVQHATIALCLLLHASGGSVILLHVAANPIEVETAKAT
jgi:hypothetical protein